MAKEKHRCEKTVYHGGFHRAPCSRDGVNFEKGQWWCKQHTPSLITAKNEANLEQWRKERVEREAATARRARREELRDKCVDIVRRLGRAFPNYAALIAELDALDGKGDADA